MSTANCNCACPDPEVSTIPGTEGDPGAAGADGISSFTLTAGVAGPFDKGDTGITVTVDDATMFYVGQYVSIEDVNTTNPGFFQITALAAAQLTLTYLDVSANSDAMSIASGKMVAPSGPPITLGALPTVLTDNSTGTASNTIAAGVGISTLVIPLTSLATGLSTLAIDLLTNYVPGYKFKLLKFDFITTVVGAGAGASQTFNLEIGTTNVTGGSLNVTLASTATIGVQTNGTAITAANTGSNTDSISIEMAAGGTVFSSGAGYFVIEIQNMDTADAIASIADHINDLINTTLA